MNKCVSVVNHSRVKLEEKKSKAIFLNPEKKDFTIARIDNCLVLEGIRADYLLSGDGHSILVELKGCDVDHACEQLFSAVEHCHVKPHLVGKIGFLIICSRVPRTTTSVQLAKSRAMKKYGAKFHVFSGQREVAMSDF